MTRRRPVVLRRPGRAAQARGDDHEHEQPGDRREHGRQVAGEHAEGGGAGEDGGHDDDLGRRGGPGRRTVRPAHERWRTAGAGRRSVIGSERPTRERGRQGASPPRLHLLTAVSPRGVRAPSRRQA
ncbi:MAG: hypothetical protein AVDCRST_MAG79-921 [uncultured Thermoleophilia bacterium]|uniref:Uncharacterized protein n=1 Tax=uncultured Thermoleophilia bacterium TaxID=1497501 RepID=A0A6J4TSD9_9ACTN|nr:MAG: hypothetical protein AVDCRST_MAG79-921 [uncultured Thermoleophilia bacterium]